jgi:hypothetical protein
VVKKKDRRAEDAQALRRTSFLLLAGLRARCAQLGEFGASARSISRLSDEFDAILVLKDRRHGPLDTELDSKMLSVAMHALSVATSCVPDSGRDLRARFAPKAAPSRRRPVVHPTCADRSRSRHAVARLSIATFVGRDEPGSSARRVS